MHPIPHIPHKAQETRTANSRYTKTKTRLESLINLRPLPSLSIIP